MRSNYKKLGPYIEQVNERNKDLKVDLLLGVSIQKIFIPSIANTVGTNMKTYKIIKNSQFAYGPVTSRNGDKVSIALLEDYDEAIVSQAYTVFKVINPDELLPEYLMMWFRRPEFDRYARFKSHGSARETFDWDELCEVELPIPPPAQQQEIVDEYNTVINRIELNKELNRKLEDTAMAIFREWDLNKWKSTLLPLSKLCSLITDGKHGDCKNEEKSGYYFVSVKDLVNGEIVYENARQITNEDFEETHRRTQFCPGDILFTNSGTIGRMAIGPDLEQTFRTTFQKSVAILKPKPDKSSSYFLYCLLKENSKAIQELASGTSQSNLLLGDLRQFEVAYPGLKGVKEFEETVTPLFEHLHQNIKENTLLRVTREMFLAKMTKMTTSLYEIH